MSSVCSVFQNERNEVFGVFLQRLNKKLFRKDEAIAPIMMYIYIIIGVVFSKNNDKMKFLYIALGGGMGAVLRYLMTVFGNSLSAYKFPWGTLMVNLLGSFLIGLAWGYSQRFQWSENFFLFLFTGLFGGFTTYSSFALESVMLFKNNEAFFGISYLFLSLFFGILLVYIGMSISK